MVEKDGELALTYAIIFMLDCYSDSLCYVLSSCIIKSSALDMQTTCSNNINILILLTYLFSTISFAHTVISVLPVSWNLNYGTMCSMPDGSHQKLAHVMQCEL